MIAGIDYSTKAVDVVLLDEDTDAATWHRFTLGALGDGFDRARTVRAAMPSSSWWEDHGVAAIGIEDPRGYGAGFLYRVQGGILQCLPRDVLVEPWIPSAWRTKVGLPGNCTKSVVACHVDEVRGAGGFGPIEAWPQDACDAYCIARATRSVVETR